MQPLFDDGKNHKNDDLKKLEQVLIFKFLMNVSLLLLDFYSYNNNMLYISWFPEMNKNITNFCKISKAIMLFLAKTTNTLKFWEGRGIYIFFALLKDFLLFKEIDQQIYLG